MISRKIAALAMTMIALVCVVTLAADDEDSPFKKLMNQVQTKTNGFRKGTKSAADYKKAVGSIPKDAEEIIKLGKEARLSKEFAEKEKKPMAEWEKLMDDMIKGAEDLSKVVAKPGSTQAQAKEAFTAYNKTCHNCHEVFKKD